MSARLAAGALGAMLLIVPTAAQAAGEPAPSAVDARVQTIEYDPDQVVTIRGRIGYQLMLEFSPGERIENVSIGDSLAWQVTPNRRANLLFLKPIEGAATNMTVVTDSRRYLFELSVAPKGSRASSPYTVRFIYPAPAQALIIPQEAIEPEPQVVNAGYAITGAKENTPVRVFDDGRMTYFQWPEDGALPAIFAVAADGSESIVNYVMRGPYVVVEQVAGRFSLRNGKQVATVTNTAYPGLEPKRRSR